jgi:hypothetical protein
MTRRRKILAVLGISHSFFDRVMISVLELRKPFSSEDIVRMGSVSDWQDICAVSSSENAVSSCVLTALCFIADTGCGFL